MPSKPIHKLLVANRGEIARRVMRTCRRMGIATVAVFSDPDRTAPFVAEADEAVHIGGALPAESYLRRELLLQAARRTGADAVHPGYGFLAEDAEFARACTAAGLNFVGPSAEAIAAMGSKLEAKRRAIDAGIPVLETVSTVGESAQRIAQAATRLGFPILVKASAGGGGKGMRIVRSAAELGEAVAAARREAQGAFGDDTVFLEPYLDGARHVEIQIFGDTHGTVVHLFERECSIQRRHQKIVEETPSVAVDDALRARMGEAAAALGRAIGYVGAGTVEFLLGRDKRFHFLEVNTRLQVEHPVTEMITGLDLVRLQILVAEGHPLPAEALSPARSGHAIEVRLYAEDPEQGYLPTTGTIHRFRLDEEPGLRVEAGVASGSVVGVHYDPMLAKIVAHAPTRPEAARRLARALERLQVHGVRTNRELLIGILGHVEFLSGETDTHFLERNPAAAILAQVRATTEGTTAGFEVAALHAAAAALAGQAERRASAPVLGSLPSGWRNVVSALQETAFHVRGAPGEAPLRIDVGYRFARDGIELRLNGTEVPNVRLGACTGDGVELEIDSVLRRFAVHRVGDTAFVASALGATELVELERFPSGQQAVAAGSLLAPMPGTVVRVSVEEGARVADGDELVVLEAMKMEHRVLAPHAGRVTEIRVRAGETVDAGVVLVVIAPDEEAGRAEREKEPGR